MDPQFCGNDKVLTKLSRSNYLWPPGERGLLILHSHETGNLEKHFIILLDSQFRANEIQFKR